MKKYIHTSGCSSLPSLKQIATDRVRNEQNNQINEVVIPHRLCIAGALMTSSTRHRVDVWPTSLDDGHTLPRCLVPVGVQCIIMSQAGWQAGIQRDKNGRVSNACWPLTWRLVVTGFLRVSRTVQNGLKSDQTVIQRAIQGDTRDFGIKGLNAGSFWCVAVIRTL